MTKAKLKLSSAGDLLALNPNEGRFLNVLPLPPGGWFLFGEHGNPPFEIPVEVAMLDNLLWHQAIGIRTREIDPENSKEKWLIFQRDGAQPNDLKPVGNLTRWRPRQDRPACPWPLRIEPKPSTFFSRLRWLLLG